MKTRHRSLLEHCFWTLYIQRGVELKDILGDSEEFEMRGTSILQHRGNDRAGAIYVLPPTRFSLYTEEIKLTPLVKKSSNIITILGYEPQFSKGVTLIPRKFTELTFKKDALLTLKLGINKKVLFTNLDNFMAFNENLNK